MAKKKAQGGEAGKGPEPHETDSGNAQGALEPAAEPAQAVPLPPRMPGEFPQPAVGVQLMMQRSSLDRLDPEIQEKLIQLSDVLDRRGYELATKDLEDRALARKQALYSISGFALLVIVAGGIFSGLLLASGQFDKAFTLLMAGIGVIGALLGGAGLQSVLKQLSGR